jgi:hypothetical protein
MRSTRIITSLFLLLFLHLPGRSQQWALDLFTGVSNYQGDMMEKLYAVQNSKMAFGLGGSYILNGHFRVRGMMHFASIGANDKYTTSPALIARNLNFTTSISEFSVTLQYDLLDLKYYKFTPYIFGGIGLFHFNPFTFDSTAGKVYLKPLSTEGQGLSAYPDRKPYALTQVCLPLGGGIRFRVNDDISLAWEIGMRKLFTDYLDDLSTTYVDRSLLLAERGQLAVDLAFRGDELKDNPGTYPPAGTIRGAPKTYDWYYFSGLTATFRLNAGPDAKEARKGSTSCPKIF